MEQQILISSTIQPVSQHLLQNLLDKNQSKREQAGYQLQKYIIKCIQNKNYHQIQYHLQFFRDRYMRSDTLAFKKIGLQAYTYISQGFIDFPEQADKYINDLTDPILQCFNDADKQVKYHAIKALYYICKFLSDACIKIFNNIFEHMLLRIVDNDEQIKKCAELLNSALKTIINDALAERKQFNLKDFMRVLTSYMRNSNPFLKEFLIDWINTIDQVPYIDLSPLLPLFLEQVLIMVGNKEKQLRTKAEDCLKDMLFDLKQKFLQGKLEIIVDEQTLSQILSILIKVTKGKNSAFTKQMAILWLVQLFEFFKQQVQNKLNIKHKYTLKKIIIQRINELLEPILALLSHEEQQVRKSSQYCNELLLQLMGTLNKQQKINFSKVVPLLKSMLSEKRSEFYTSQSVLTWMKFLLQHYNDKILPQINDIIQKLVEKLWDGNTKSVSGILENVSFNQQYFDLVIQRLLNLMFINKNIDLGNTHNGVLYTGYHVLRRAAEVLDGRRMYPAICIQILTYQDSKFVQQVVLTLKQLLIIEHSLKKLRDQLRDLKNNQHRELFFVLFKAFSYSRISALVLCFLAQEYFLAFKLIESFAIDGITAELILELCEFVNTLQSPAFIFMRLHMLENESYPYLIQCMYSLMMLLPQGKICTTLKNRLDIAGRSKNLKKQVKASVFIKQYLKETQQFFQMYKHTTRYNKKQ